MFLISASPECVCHNIAQLLHLAHVHGILYLGQLNHGALRSAKGWHSPKTLPPPAALKTLATSPLHHHQSKPKLCEMWQEMTISVYFMDIYIYIIWYDISDIYERNAMTIIVHPGISCCRVKGTSAFWKCHETFETSYQWLVPGLWYSRPFRGYAWLRYSPRQVWWAPLWQDLWPRPLRPLWPWPTRGSARGAECCNKNPCMEKCRVIHI